MSDQQMSDISHKIYAAIMLRRFAQTTQTGRKMHQVLADEAEARANRLLEV